MKPVLIAGMIIVNLALIFYTIGIIREQRTKLVSRKILTFLILGVIFDIVATICMIMGSSQGGLTLHGFIGYSSLLGMLIDTILIFKHYKTFGPEAPVPRNLHLYTRIAYGWWVIAYITGALIVAFR